MPRKRLIDGTMIQGEQPVWEPLVHLVGVDRVEDFMWMFEVELADGTRLHAYKHIDTRRYIHAAADGRTFGYTDDGRYREIDPPRAVRLALAGASRLRPEVT